MIPKQYLELLKDRKECQDDKFDVIDDIHSVLCSCQGTGFEPLTLIFPEKLLKCECINFITHVAEGKTVCMSCDGSGLIWKEGEIVEYFEDWDRKDGYPIGSIEYKFKIISLERKRLNTFSIFMYSIEDKVLLKDKEFGKLKDNEMMILVKV